MIVKMQKVTILVSSREREDALTRLQALGVVHVQAVKTPASEDLQALETEAANVDRALQIAGAETDDADAETAQVGEQVKQILWLAQRKEALLRELAEHQGNDRWFETWGAVSYASLQAIRDAGISVRFYIGDRRALKNLPAEAIVEVIRETDRNIYLAHFSEVPGQRLDLREDPMPQVEVSEMRARMAEILREVARIDQELKDLAGAGPGLRAYRKELAQRLLFHRVKHGMGEAGRIAYLQGFCPEEAVDALKAEADAAGWAYVVEDPDDPSVVPTLIRTPAWVRIIQPVFGFMGTVPGYQEYDISFWFLLFFSLFYAILVGDAGYGLIFLGATLFFHRKVTDAPKEPFILMYVLSGATLLWGALSGTWFGMANIFNMPSLAFLNDLVIPQIRSVTQTPEEAKAVQDFLMYLCFVIGAVHLSVAHGLIAMRNIKSPVAFSQVGWIAIIWSLFFVANALVLKQDFPAVGMYLLIGGLVLVLLFANFQRNILKGALVTLGDLPLTVISSFSDVVSYLRLFAVGFATTIVASSFNGMAADVWGGVVGGLSAALILILGHGINIILALMAVVVHGIRLNMLEFSGHLGMQWSGKPYQPFKASSEA